jgi:hypothetical protein
VKPTIVAQLRFPLNADPNKKVKLILDNPRP